MICFGVGTGINIYFQTKKIEDKSEKFRQAIEDLAFEWSKKFGDKKDIFNLENVLHSIKGEYLYFSTDTKEFWSWWMERRLFIYESLFDKETASKRIETEREALRTDFL